MELASVREKGRSRHASQALLFFLCVAVRTVHVAASIDSGPAMRLPSWRVSARLWGVRGPRSDDLTHTAD